MPFSSPPALSSLPGSLASFWSARRCWCCGLDVQFPACFSRGATFPLFQLCPGGCTRLDAAEAGATAALPLPGGSFRCPAFPEGPGQTKVAFAAFPAPFAAPARALPSLWLAPLPSCAGGFAAAGTRGVPARSSQRPSRCREGWGRVVSFAAFVQSFSWHRERFLAPGCPVCTRLGAAPSRGIAPRSTRESLQSFSLSLCVSRLGRAPRAAGGRSPQAKGLPRRLRPKIPVKPPGYLLSSVAFATDSVLYFSSGSAAC